MHDGSVQSHNESVTASVSAASLLAAAEELCRERGERLTPTRRRVFELILARGEPVGAYALLDGLRAADGRSAAPPTVYRALDFLLAQGLIHRIESLNAFAACAQGCGHHQAQYLICHRCGAAQEIADAGIAAAIAAAARAYGFQIEQQHVEIKGVCAECTTRPPAHQRPERS